MSTRVFFRQFGRLWVRDPEFLTETCHLFKEVLGIEEGRSRRFSSLFLFHNRQWGGISAGLCEHSICSWLFYKKHNVIDDDRTFICDKVFLKTLPEDVFNGISEKFLNETIAASFAFILVHIPSRDAYLDMYPPTWKFSIVEQENCFRPPLLNMLTNEKLEFLRCRVSLFGNQLEADVLRRSRIAQ
ncbi:hypothetical protein DdX_20364 [Ditylenchus destructor]|uniref:Uncharacterized protein n=1 Tax=Ditylenchus destructor TaxID=166010 RepID=A0AAD4QW93_9BILA|nr:hypothetical protein DdX_20364 [Ditylenchus destructor]